MLTDHNRCTADLSLVGLNPFMVLLDERSAYTERETFDAFLQLPAAQRKIIREVILTFAKANGVAEGHAQK
jgi:hypothetical protein